MRNILTTPVDAEQAFYFAFRTLDRERMRSVWLATPEIYCIHPNGPLLLGRDAVLESWFEIFTVPRPPHLEHKLLRRQQRDGVSVHLVEERIGPRGSSSSELSFVLATNVYLETELGWRILGHHASVPRVPKKSPIREQMLH